MKKYNLLIISLLLILTSFTKKENEVENRSLYVDNFSNILGTPHLEEELFSWAKSHKITTLILYDLNKVHKRFHLGDSTENHILANFIKKAKTEHGIKKISASGESGDFFIEAIHPYNLSRKNSLEKFDIYNLEYEYWKKKESENGGYYCETYLKRGQLKCNRENSFEYFIQSLEIMKLLSEELDEKVEVEAYIGNFNHNEVKKVSDHVDRLLIHDYVNTPEKLFPYVKERLDLLEKIDSKIKLSILYSAEMNFLGSWLKKHPIHEAEKKFFDQLKENKISLEEHLNFEGFTYYNYDYFRYVVK